MLRDGASVSPGVFCGVPRSGRCHKEFGTVACRVARSNSARARARAFTTSILKLAWVEVFIVQPFEERDENWMFCDQTLNCATFFGA